MFRTCTALASVAFVISVFGCAVSENSTAPVAVPASVPALNAAEPAAPAKPAMMKMADAPAPLESPATIAFSERSIKLDAEQRNLVARIAAEADKSAQIVLTGQSDRAAATNAREIAIARAAAVRDALKEAGIATKNFRIRYSTAQPRHGVVVHWK